MPLNQTDEFIIQRGSAQYRMTADQIALFVGAIKDYTAADLVERDHLEDFENIKVGDRIFVVDATLDPSVLNGWAVYRVASVGPTVFDKIQEQEGMDVTVTGSNLAYSSAPNQGTITNSGGDDVTLPVVDGTNAGLATPAMFANNHTPASAALTAQTNPVIVNADSQQVSFDISQLLPLP